MTLLAAAAFLAGCGAAAPSTEPGASGTPAALPAVSAATSSAAPSTPAPTQAPTAVAAPTATPAGPFTLTSSAFKAGGAIPVAYTCTGADVSPDLAWTGLPAHTNVLVLVVTDLDASFFTHWIVLDMQPALAGGLARGAGAPSSPLHQGTNDFGRVGWGGPCPPSGVHHYRFTLYALEGPLGLEGHPGQARVNAALAKATTLSTATLQGLYRRP